MREIEFRGKRRDGEWVYGSLMQYYEEDVAYICWKGQSLGPNLGVIPDVDFSEEVDFETVGQYTGLKDKNGTKIFEGDIVVLRHGTHGMERKNLIITYGKCGFFARNSWGISSGYTLDTEFIEVIGNIHENSELK